MAALSGWWDDFFFGTLMVLRVFVAALVLAVIFGLLGASAKLSRSRAAQTLAKAYTVIFRGTPELVVLLLFYFGTAIVLTVLFMPKGIVGLVSSWGWRRSPASAGRAPR